MSSSKRSSPGSGHIRKRTLKDQTVRYDVLVHKDGKQTTIKGGLTEYGDAVAYLAAWLDERVKNGARAPFETGIMTVRKVGEGYLKTLSGTRLKEEGSRWRARVEEVAEFIDWPVSQLNERACQRWIDQQARTPIAGGKSKGQLPQRQTIQNVIQTLRNVLRWARIEGHVDRNVAESITISDSTMLRVKSGGSDYDFLHVDEVRRILESKTLPQRIRVAYTLLAFTGARPKDLYTLGWDRVDVEGKTIFFRSQKKGRDYLAHLLPIALDAVREWWIRCGRPRTGLVFCGENGEPHTKGYDWGWASTRGRRKWKKYNRAGELVEYAARRGVTESAGWREKIGIARPVPLYSLRHTCASHLLLGTELFTGGRIWSLPEIASHLGHADTSTVERYAKALGIASQRAVIESREALGRGDKPKMKKGAREGI